MPKDTDISLALIACIPASACTFERGMDLFGKALAGHGPNRSEEMLRVDARRRAERWFNRETTVAVYTFRDRPSIDIRAEWGNSTQELKMPPGADENCVHPVFNVLTYHVDEFSSEAAIEFVEERFVAVLDVLKPPWAVADAYLRLGLGGRTPKPPHWLTLFPPGKGADARALAEEVGGRVDARPWGGFVVVARPHPLRLPGSKPRTAFKGPTEHVPTDTFLVAGVDLGDPDEGEPTLLQSLHARGLTRTDPAEDPGVARLELASALRPGRAPARLRPGDLAHLEAMAEGTAEATAAGQLGEEFRGKASSIRTRLREGMRALREAQEAPLRPPAPAPYGELRCFVSADVDDAVLGVPVKALSFRGPDDQDASMADVDAGLEVARRELARLGIAEEPQLFLVWVGETLDEVREGGA